MPLQIKPHTIQIRTVTQVVGANSVFGNPSAATYGTNVACFCSPLEPKESYERFGVVVTDSWVVLLELGDAAVITPDAEILFRGQTYTVRGDIERHENGDDADCARLVMTRLQYPEAS